MSPETLTFDPHGDVVLILNHKSEAGPADPNSSSGEGITSGNDESSCTMVNMFVSSKHMILASSVFAAMLRGDFIEGSTLLSEGRVEILLPDDEPDIFTILLNIIHGRTKMVPRRIGLVQLTKLSILVDKYRMQEVVGAFAEIWIENLKANIPEDPTEEVIFWLCISWVFEEGVIFQKVTGILMRMSDIELDKDVMEQLPIPEIITRRIQYERREGSIASMLLVIQDLLGDYKATMSACKRVDGKKAFCDAMVVGSLLQASQKARLWPFPEPPYGGLTVEGVKMDILTFKIRTLCDVTNPGMGLEVHERRSPRPMYDDDEELTASRTASQAIKNSISTKMYALSVRSGGLNMEDFK